MHDGNDAHRLLAVLGGEPVLATRRQEQLLTQITALFLAEGFARLTLEGLAARLHCSKSTIYAIAPSREQLATTVAVRYFRDAAARIEAGASTAGNAAGQLDAYLRGVARELGAASAAFMADVAAFEPTRRIYELNTSIAAERIRRMLAEGVETGVFRPIATVFVADVVAGAMVAIQSRRTAASTGLTDAEAYSALADLVLGGVRS